MKTQEPVIRNSWTGTPGVTPVLLEDDFEKTLEGLEERLERYRQAPTITEYTSTIVARAWEWALEEFDCDVDLERFSVRELVEFYLEN